MKISFLNKLAKRFGSSLAMRSSRTHRRAAATAILAGGLTFLGAVSDAPAIDLITNGGFEMNDGGNGDNVGFGWLNPDGPPVFDVYSHATEVYYEGAAPAGAGAVYFHTVGVGNSQGVFQDLDLTAAATTAQIDAGTVGFKLGGWLSGYTAQDDHPDLSVQFFDASSNAIAGPAIIDGAEFGPGSNFVTTVGGADPSTAANPLAVWKQYEMPGGVFVGARTARVTVLSDSLTGNGNDNYTDLVSFDVADTGVEQFLKVRVDTGNGSTSIVNATGTPVDINFYEILSPGGSLNAGGWNSFDNQDLDSLGGNPGQNWDEGGGSDASQIVEAFLLGTSTLSGTNTLGSAFNTTVGAQDLEFFYAGANDLRLRGIVEYVSGGIDGDFDDNSDYDTGDVDALVNEIVAGTNNAAFDLTGDGLVNLADLGAWRAEAGAAELASGNAYLVGDVNLDGSVNSPDLGQLLNNFNGTGSYSGGDLNADGNVNSPDLGLLLNNFNRVAAQAAAVPEPATAVWTLIVMVGLVFRRKQG